MDFNCTFNFTAPPTGSSVDYSSSTRNTDLFSKQEIEQLRQLFYSRYNKNTSEWPKAYPKAELDCEGLAHYLMAGKIGRFDEKNEVNKIYQVDLKKGHRPYTVYEICQPRAPWVREELGFWGAVHYFVHLEDGKYISKNGFGPIRFFDSFEDMLQKDAFPFGFITEDYTDTNDIERAAIGESLIGPITNSLRV
ncbi:MAG: hypothetical protein K1000chlam3_01394 [Chlamydiae bacterium]|nr:hypothetical protein [Chlamydiota bacterium]